MVFPVVWPWGCVFDVTIFRHFHCRNRFARGAQDFTVSLPVVPLGEELFSPCFSSNGALDDRLWCFQWFGHVGVCYRLRFCAIFITNIVSLGLLCVFARCPAW